MAIELPCGTALATFYTVTEPVTHAALSSEAALTWSGRFLPLALTLCLGVALSLTAFYAVRTSENQRIEREFHWRARSQVQAVQVGVERFEECLYTLRDLFYATEHVSPSEFRDTASDLLQRHPAICLLQWLPEVPASGRAEFEAPNASTNLPGQTIFETGDTENRRAGEYPAYA